jgi:hypothetical protein
MIQNSIRVKVIKMGDRLLISIPKIYKRFFKKGEEVLISKDEVR